jgi:hypothetical protein
MRRRRIYFDWRILFFYPLAFAVPAAMIYSFSTYGLDMTTFQYCLAVTVFTLTPVWMWRAAREGVYCDAEGVTIRWAAGPNTLVR